MSPRIAHCKAGSVVTLLGLIFGSAAVLAAEPPPGHHPTAPTKEQREKMATIHEQMAACLRSDKPIADCHDEAMKSCKEAMSKDGCPMMGMGHKGMHDRKKAEPPNPDDHH